MQLIIRHTLPDKLVLPLNYNHIIQAIIYKSISPAAGYSDFLHDNGFSYGSRSYKLFCFSLLQGKYEIVDKKIIFRNEVFFEVRSPDIFMIRILADSISRNGIDYGELHVSDVDVSLWDETIEDEAVQIQMVSPVCVYTTNPDSRKTCFYTPMDAEFAQLINENFIRKYTACYGIEPDGSVALEPLTVTGRDKFVTRYKGFYISGWKGTYYLYGARKHLDFLFQSGLGTRNSQGFGMFNVL